MTTGSSVITSSIPCKPFARGSGNSTCLAQAHPEWLGIFSNNRHIAEEDWAGFEEPFLVDLETDPGETKSVAGQHPEVVAQL
jgi:hypothetical protein